MTTPLHGRRLEGQEGAAVVEFALLLPLLMALVFGVVELGRAVWYYDALDKATRNAARYLSTIPVASFSGELANNSTTESIVVAAATKASVPGFSASQVTVSCTPTATCTAPAVASDITYVSVDVAYPITLGAWFPMITPPISLTSAVTMGVHATLPYMR